MWQWNRGRVARNHKGRRYNASDASRDVPPDGFAASVGAAALALFRQGNLPNTFSFTAFQIYFLKEPYFLCSGSFNASNM